MTQLIENKPRRRALIATLSHFCAHLQFLASTIKNLPANFRKSERTKPLVTRHSPLATAFLINSGSRLEIDVTHSESARSAFLIVAESRYSTSAICTLFSSESRTTTNKKRIETAVGGKSQSEERFLGCARNDRRRRGLKSSGCGVLAPQPGGKAKEPARCRRYEQRIRRTPFDSAQDRPFGCAPDMP